MFLHQTGREAAAERLIENLDGVVVRIVAASAELHHTNVALVYVGLRDQIVAGFGGRKFDVGRFVPRGLSPRSRKPARSLASMAAESKSPTMPRMMLLGATCAMVPVEQILTGDGGHGGVFGLARVGIAGAVSQLGGFARRRFRRHHRCGGKWSRLPVLARSSLSSRNSGSRSSSAEELENVVEISFQARQGNRSGIRHCRRFRLSLRGLRDSRQAGRRSVILVPPVRQTSP